jgi:hypothetical protein
MSTTRSDIISRAQQLVCLICCCRYLFEYVWYIQLGAACGNNFVCLLGRCISIEAKLKDSTPLTRRLFCAVGITSLGIGNLEDTPSHYPVPHHTKSTGHCAGSERESEEHLTRLL